jgi:hypothetical protein
MSNEELTEIFLKYLKPENKKRQVDINKLRVLCISELYDKYYKDKNKNCMISAKDAKKIIELIYYKLFDYKLTNFNVEEDSKIPVLGQAHLNSITINCELINQAKGIKKLGLINTSPPSQYQYNYKPIFDETLSDKNEDKLRDLLMFMLLIEHELIHVLLERYGPKEINSHGDFFITLSNHIFGHTYSDLALSHFKMYYDSGYDGVKFRKSLLSYGNQFNDSYVDNVLPILEEIRIQKKNEYKIWFNYNPYRTFTEFLSFKFKSKTKKSKSKTKKSKSKTKKSKSKTKSKKSKLK